MCYLYFLPFTFLPSPHHSAFPRGGWALSWKVTFAAGQADGSSPRQAQFSSLTMCHSKALKISVLDTPGLLLNLGHWQHKALLKAPTCDADPSRTIPHLSDGQTCTMQLQWFELQGFFFLNFFLLLFLVQPLQSLAHISSQKQSLYQKASDLPSALPQALIRSLFFFFP